MNINGYKICSRCVMDTSDLYIQFDRQGICNHCLDYDRVVLPRKRRINQLQESLAQLAKKIKYDGKDKDYDCIIGISGGVDSTFLAYLTVEKLGLRPLAVHLDNGWNSRQAVRNIKNIIKRLGIDLHTHVIEWNEFRDLQRAYFKASVLDIEATTDHAILTLMYNTAAELGVKYILAGSNLWTEKIIPKSWTFNKNDLTNILAIHRRFGELTLDTFPRLGLSRLLYLRHKEHIKTFYPLNFIDFNKNRARETIEKQLRWLDYGGKHHESVFTRFYQGVILPKKFGIDKRRAHLSSLINAGQMSREDALKELALPPYPLEQQEMDQSFVTRKLGFSQEEFEEYLHTPPRSHFDYPTDPWSKLDRKYLAPGSYLRKFMSKIFYAFFYNK